ncbi:hypothetical protein [Blastococcus brunescens]|uniref:HEPN domain-containing protein n=1 Tax=Blastococcus brunescens TaxID=1564165 RepID=A0ABZ1AZR1_9ACTN|nr:hypothetical protein [Blastococcus sp. BMG 8361]WRL64046.1 hypothetical protein U6N30_31430 [Blastococcus sp. BMG 8361]
MSAWQRGAAEVDAMLAERALQRVPAAVGSAAASLARARQLLDSSATLAGTDPDSAYVLAYDAARHAGTAVLARQGLRATTSGGHIAVERVLRAQFAPGFADFHVLRRRRNELEYPGAHGPETVSSAETDEALQAATGIVDQAEQLLPRLDLF